MVKGNENYLNLKESYLFSTIAKKVSEYSKLHPEKKLIKLGIGDVTLPLAPEVIKAVHEAAEDMAKKETFKGYGPESGYDFLKKEIIKHDFSDRGIDIAENELFVSDGAKCDTGNIGDIFDKDNVVLVTDPVYPVYVDTNIMAGRQIKFVDGNEENDFAPEPPDFGADLIYLCSPNNPTGSVMTKEKLKKWVDYAISNNAVILFDAAYEAYIRDENLPRSIYEIPGAKKVAIEFRSFSKTAGFTGMRCGFSVVPNELFVKGKDGRDISLNALWSRRHATKYNGTPYIIQKAAAATYTEEGRKQIRESIDYYMENARLIKKGLTEISLSATGGDNAPYIWLKCPNGMGSWEFFDFLLDKAGVIGTPGAGFGKMGEGYFRLTAFGSRESTIEAIERIKNVLK